MSDFTNKALNHDSKNRPIIPVQCYINKSVAEKVKPILRAHGHTWGSFFQACCEIVIDGDSEVLLKDPARKVLKPRPNSQKIVDDNIRDLIKFMHDGGKSYLAISKWLKEFKQLSISHSHVGKVVKGER